MIAKEPQNYLLKSTKKGCTFRTFPFGLHCIHCGKVITTHAYPRSWLLQESHSTSKNPTNNRIKAGHQFRAAHLTYKRLHPFSMKHYHCTFSRASLKRTGNVTTPYMFDSFCSPPQWAKTHISGCWVLPPSSITRRSQQ